MNGILAFVKHNTHWIFMDDNCHDHRESEDRKQKKNFPHFNPYYHLTSRCQVQFKCTRLCASFFFMQPEVQSYKFLLYCVLYKINFLCNDNMLRNWLYGLASVKCYNVTYASLFSGILNNALSRSKKCDSLIYLNQSWIS